jgi:DNA-binding MarR family transcriptional regulator
MYCLPLSLRRNNAVAVGISFAFAQEPVLPLETWDFPPCLRNQILLLTLLFRDYTIILVVLMNVENELIEKLYKMLNIVNDEMKTARDYGVGFEMYHSEMHLLEAIYNHEGANASELSKILGFTNGAISQVTKKLLDKALIENYQIPNNKKEVYFRLTDLGLKAFRGHRKHHAKINAPFFDFMSNQATEKDIQAIIKFMDIIINSFEPVVSRKIPKRKN